MCMIDGSERPKVYQENKYHARAKYMCYECNRDIKPGELYRRAFIVEYGETHSSTFRTCQHCMVAQDWLVYNCNGYLFGGVEEDIREHTIEYNHSVLQIGLYRLVVGMRRQWRRFDKIGLMSLPKEPISIESIMKE